MNNDFLDFSAEMEKSKDLLPRQEKMAKAIEFKKQELHVESDEELRASIPSQSSAKNGRLELVRIDGVGLTEKGDVTLTGFFENLRSRSDIYADLTFTKNEALAITNRLRNMSTGVNSVTALICTGPMCIFASTCPFQQIGKAPLSRPCPVEGELLEFHTRKFIEEFEVDPAKHSEIMLVQELSELIVYEMRLAQVLANPDNADLLGEKITFDPNGNQITEIKEHPAFGIKERIKNRRMKILDSLLATRSSKKTDNKDNDDQLNSYADGMKKMMEKLNTMREVHATDATYEETK